MITLFISHASEDKQEIAEPLTRALQDHFKVWLDKDQLLPGDRLRAGINRGLTEADYGIVILSTSYLNKYWTQEELGGLTAIESVTRKVIIPIRYKVSVEQIKTVDPMIAGRIMIDGELPLSDIVNQIKLATDSAKRASEMAKPPNAVAKLKSLNASLLADKRAEELSHSPEGVAAVSQSYEELMDCLEASLKDLNADNGLIRFDVKRENNGLFASSPFSICCSINYRCPAWNSLHGSRMTWMVYEHEWPVLAEFKVKTRFQNMECNPAFDDMGRPIWKCRKDTWSSSEIAELILENIVHAISKKQKK